MASAGFVIFQLGRIPAVDDTFFAYEWRSEVIDVDGRRIDKLLAKLLEH